MWPAQSRVFCCGLWNGTHKAGFSVSTLLGKIYKGALTTKLVGLCFAIMSSIDTSNQHQKAWWVAYKSGVSIKSDQFLRRICRPFNSLAKRRWSLHANYFWKQNVFKPRKVDLQEANSESTSGGKTPEHRAVEPCLRFSLWLITQVCVNWKLYI